MVKYGKPDKTPKKGTALRTRLVTHVEPQPVIPVHEDDLSSHELVDNRRNAAISENAGTSSSSPTPTPIQQQESTATPPPLFSTVIADQPLNETPGSWELQHYCEGGHNYHSRVIAGCIRECEERETQAAAAAAEKFGEQNVRAAADGEQVEAEAGTVSRDSMPAGRLWSLGSLQKKLPSIGQDGSKDDDEMVSPLLGDRLEYGELIPGDDSLLESSSEHEAADEDMEAETEEKEGEDRDEEKENKKEERGTSRRRSRRARRKRKARRMKRSRREEKEEEEEQAVENVDSGGRDEKD